MIIFVGSLLAWAAIAMLVTLATFLLFELVGAILKRIRRRNGGPVVVFSEEEKDELIREVEKRNSEVGKSLREKFSSREKLTAAQGTDGYEFDGYKASNPNDDDMRYGGKVFSSGEYIQYDRYGNESNRGVLRA